MIKAQILHDIKSMYKDWEKRRKVLRRDRRQRERERYI